MLSVRTLAKIGPWTLTGVDWLEPHEPLVGCERCATPIREVWCVTVDAPDAALAARNLRRDWRVGNECGPQLIQESERFWEGGQQALDSGAQWRKQTKELRARLRLLSRLLLVVEAATRAGRELSIARELEEGRRALLAGPIEDRRRRRLNLIVTGTGRGLGLWP